MHMGCPLQKDCNGVDCGANFLCTIAPKDILAGQAPEDGDRAGAPYQINRQLPDRHMRLKTCAGTRIPLYMQPVGDFNNRIGSMIHRHYGVFDRKWVGGPWYILRGRTDEAVGWIFLLTLYLVDVAIDPSTTSRAVCRRGPPVRDVFDDQARGRATARAAPGASTAAAPSPAARASRCRPSWPASGTRNRLLPA